MQRRTLIAKKALLVLALCFSTAVGGGVGAAETAGVSHSNSELVEMTRNALQAQDVLQDVAYQAYAHDDKIGEGEKGDLELLPEQIIPWSVSDKRSVSVVRVRTTIGNKQKLYTYAFVFSPKGLKTMLLFPGNSNADPALFSDLFAPAKGYAQGALESDDVYIKNTKVLGEITASGWSEEWLWVNDKRKTYAMTIDFSTGAHGGGTFWKIKK